MKRLDFASYVRRMPFSEGSNLILDNCSIHHGNTPVFCEKGYNALFLPPYSPQYQPVELAFSKIKQAFRQRWPWDAGIEAAIDECVNSVTSQDIKGWFRHCERILMSCD